MRAGRLRRMALALALTLAVTSAVALAFSSAAGAGSASAITGSLAAAAIAVPGSAINSVTVTWTTQASLTPTADNAAVTYSVQRKLGGGAWAAVASGGCSGSKARGMTSCADAPAAAGSYGYRVVASYRTWTATSNEAGPASFVLDSVAPTTQSIARSDAATTNAATVHWTVTFSETVTGVDEGDFALARTGGVAGGSISSVSGSGTTYSVTSSTGSGDGTLGLNLVDDDTITDVGANKLGGSGTGNGNLTGATYGLDRTAPTVTSIARIDTSPSNAGTVHWTVTFSETVTGVDTSDFALARTGSLTGGSISSVSGSTTTYTVTSSTGSGDGTLGLNLVDDDTITDTATNKLGGTGAANGNLTGATYTIDNTAPTMTDLSMLDANTNGKIDQVTATFSEPLASSSLTSQWTLSGTVPSGATLASVGTTGALATLTLTEGGGAANTAVGTFKLALAANGSGIRDLAGNQASFGATAPSDKAGPVPISVSDTNAVLGANGRIDLLDTFQAIFSEAIASGVPVLPTITESRASSGNVFLTISGVTDGALDMSSADYLSGTGVASTIFTGTGLLSGGNTITITVTVSTSGATLPRSGSGTSMAYRPSPTLLDAAGNAAAGSITTGFTIF